MNQIIERSSPSAFDLLMRDLWGDRSATYPKGEWLPHCDIEEGKDSYRLSLDVPGIKADQIKIEVEKDQIIVSGERKHESKKEAAGETYTERRFGKFQRIFSLPNAIDIDKIEAEHADGVLKIHVPKAASSQLREIKIGQKKNPLPNQLAS